MTDPKLYFAIDNCFASKRWTEPEEWARLIAGLGIRYVEASADTECDPLYMGTDYVSRWTERTAKACTEAGITVANLYSGHGTYSTLGLAHWDEQVRLRFRDDWIKKQMDAAAALGAGMGFFAHAFDHLVLQDPELYQQKLQELYENLEDIAAYARQIGMDYVNVEQMYAPHQVPWTIKGARELIGSIYAMHKNPFYITTDVGHMSGQRNFHRPEKDSLVKALEQARTGKYQKGLWLGTQEAMELFRRESHTQRDASAVAEEILALCDRVPHMFAQEEDGSPYRWLEELGCYSPIIHLQQSDGLSSPHWPFDAAHNKNGIIKGRELMQAIVRSYEAQAPAGMPPKCEKIVLTLEPFISTGGNPYDAVEGIRESVTYWRQFLPEDGMHLSQVRSLLAL